MLVASNSVMGDRGRWRARICSTICCLLRQTIDVRSSRSWKSILHRQRAEDHRSDEQDDGVPHSRRRHGVRRPTADRLRPSPSEGHGQHWARNWAEAIHARNHFVSALTSLGWPAPALGVSGNGAHALYRSRLRADEATAITLRTLYRGWRPEFSSDVCAVRLDRLERVAHLAPLWDPQSKGRGNTRTAASRIEHQYPSTLGGRSTRGMITNLAHAYAERERAACAGRATAPRRTAAPAGHR